MLKILEQFRLLERFWNARPESALAETALDRLNEARAIVEEAAAASRAVGEQAGEDRSALRSRALLRTVDLRERCRAA